MTKVEVGQIWMVVRKGFLGKCRASVRCEHCGETKATDVETEIIPNMRIEIRYPYEWHYRTETNKYYQSSEKHLLDHCEYYGTVIGEIRSRNEHNLSEILSENLYEPVSEQED